MEEENVNISARVGNLISSDLSNLGVLKKFVKILSKVLKFSDVVITQSKAMDLDVKKYISKETQIIYNPIIKKEI